MPTAVPLRGLDVSAWSREATLDAGHLDRREAGFTLIELLIVTIIVGILASVAIASYLGARDRGNSAVAEARVRQIVPSIEAYGSDQGTYVGMTVATLRARYDSSLADAAYSFGTLTASSYCVHSTAGGETWRKPGPGEPIVPGACP